MIKEVKRILEDVDQAFDAGTKARLHPNGFVQLDLSDNRRLHVWPTEPLPAPSPELPIHDHTFSFSSTVLAGVLKNIHHEDIKPNDNSDFHMYEIYPFLAGHGHNPFVHNDKRRFKIGYSKCYEYQAGETYTFPAHAFHETQVEGLTATVMSYGSINPSLRARVLCQTDREPDATFDRYTLPQHQLWGIIDQVVNLVH